MKIALYNLTTTTRWGGVETFVWEVATQMSMRGHKVEIFGGRGPQHLRRPCDVRAGRRRTRPALSAGRDAAVVRIGQLPRLKR